VDDEAVVAEVAVVALVVVDGPGVLGPQLRLVETQVGRAQETLGQVEEVGMKDQPVQVPRSPRGPDETGAPLATLDPRVEPRVYEKDDFAVTLWTYYEPVAPRDIAPDQYASALERLHAGMRQAELTGDWLPHFMDRVDEAQRLVDDPTNNPEIAGADRALLGTTLRTMRRAIIDRGASEQLLHGEPHPGNVLRTSGGLLFVDLETCCRGPIEFDIAHATLNASGPPIKVGALYAGADQSLVHECWILMLAMVTAWRCEPGDDLPNGRAMAMHWIRQLRAALGP
jgi:hypothetical protein